MQNNKNHQKASFSHVHQVLSVLGILFTLGIWNFQVSPEPQSEERMHFSPAAVTADERIDALIMRQAKRLQRRLEARGESASIDALARALADRKEIAGRDVLLTLTTDDGSEPVAIVLTLQERPDWLTFRSESTEFRVDGEAIKNSLERGDVPEIRMMRTSEINAMERDNKNVLRATSDVVARDGYAFDLEHESRRIADAFMHGDSAVTIQTSFSEPTVTVTLEDGSKKTLTLLSTGISDFSNSTPGRLWNVHKAFDERVNNIVVEPGETFSLVAALDAPVTLSKGWKEDIGLFGGGTALTPGAGICQSATTLYRAALLAGLPFVERKNHSLFVDHYEFFGVGLDATVFPGVQDLKFKNDTDELMVIQAYTEGDTAYVHFFGEDDGRTATLDGPYFAGSKNRPSALRPLSNFQIGWVRTITYADGTVKTQPFVSTYAKPVWRSLVKKYDGRNGMELLVSMQ